MKRPIDPNLENFDSDGFPIDVDDTVTNNSPFEIDDEMLTSTASENQGLSSNASADDLR